MTVSSSKSSAPVVTPAEKLELYYWMRLTRALDDRCDALFKQGKIPGVIFSQRGHEAISVGSSFALEDGDVIAPLHRDLGAFLLRGMKPEQVVAQALGRVGGPSRGRDANTHGFGDMELGIIGYVSHLPQSMPVTLGAAFALQYRGGDRVALNYFGDGSASEGGTHETLNLAAVLQAPVVFILENNQYAYSTPLEHQCRVTDLASRAVGVGMPGVTVDGNDVLAVLAATRDAVARARRGDGPTLIVANTMRMRGHAIHDSAEYVPEELLDEWTARDPIATFEALLLDEGVLDDAARTATGGRIRAQLDEAVDKAEASPWPDPDTLTDGVFVP